MKHISPYLYITNIPIKKILTYCKTSGLGYEGVIWTQFNPQRVNDGGEYSALFYAWDTHFDLI